MPKSSSIFNFKKLPQGLVYFLLAVFFLESVVFSKAYLLASRDLVCIAYKDGLIKKRHGAEIVILGLSRALSVNARSLEELTDGKKRVYNYSFPNLGIREQLFLVTKKYLFFCGKPELIIASLPVESFFKNEEKDILGTDGICKGPPRPEINRLVRFIDLWALLNGVPFPQGYILIPPYIMNLLPSMHYSAFIRRSLSPLSWRSIRRCAGVIRERIKILEDLQSTNGQLLFSADKVVREEEVNAGPPSDFGKNIDFSAFEKYLSLCDQSHIPTIFMFMPLHKLRYDTLKRAGWIDSVSEGMKRLEKKYHSFRYYQMTALSYEGEFFGDFSHLNKAGADKFNKEFKPAFRFFLQAVDKKIPVPDSQRDQRAGEESAPVSREERRS